MKSRLNSVQLEEVGTPLYIIQKTGAKWRTGHVNSTMPLQALVDSGRILATLSKWYSLSLELLEERLRSRVHGAKAISVSELVQIGCSFQKNIVL